jgi:uncharacterized membrane protein
MRRLLPLLVTSLLFAGACGDDDDPVMPAGSVTVATTAITAEVPHAGTTTIPITITRAGGFTGATVLTAENLPTGVTATFTPTTIEGNATTSTLTLSASAAAAAGTTPIAVRASGSGINSGVFTIPFTIGPAPGITLTSGATAATASQGGAIAIPIVISRVGGYTGDVTLAAQNVPANSTASFSPATLTGGQLTTTLTLTPSATAAAGASTVTVRATGVGMGAQTQTLNYTVRASTTTGFGISASPAVLTLTAGDTATSAVTLLRTNGFPGFIELTAAGAPAGMTVTVSPSPITGSTATVRIATTNATAPGVYTIALTGVSTGVANATASIIVVVNAPPPV